MVTTACSSIRQKDTEKENEKPSHLYKQKHIHQTHTFPKFTYTHTHTTQHTHTHTEKEKQKNLKLLFLNVFCGIKTHRVWVVDEHRKPTHRLTPQKILQVIFDKQFVSLSLSSFKLSFLFFFLSISSSFGWSAFVNFSL